MAGSLFRSEKKGGSLLLTGALFLGILVMLNVAAGRLASRADWTGENRYSLSPQTHRILSSLDKDVQILAFLQTSDPDQDELRRLLDEYAAASRHVRSAALVPGQPRGPRRESRGCGHRLARSRRRARARF